MPSSAHCHISYMLKRIYALNPSSVLDLGVGFGKWGFLCREYLDIFKGRLKPELWKTRIDGIEIFSNYRNPIWPYVYDSIYLGDALEYVCRKGIAYDLSIAGDILEHFEKEDGVSFLQAVREISKHCLFGVPVGNGYKQGAALGNEHEKHLAVWEESELKQWGKVTMFREQIRNRPYAVLEM